MVSIKILSKRVENMKQREHVRKTALEMVKKHGLINLSRHDLCKRAEIPPGSFPYIMGCNFTAFIAELKIETNDNAIYSVNKTRANPILRRDHILQVAIKIARTIGYQKVTRGIIAESAGVSTGLVTHYFKTMPQLKRAIMRTAIAQEIPEIIAQGLINNDKHAIKASPELRAKAAATIIIN
jgi:DNA-binding transcriptional regulator YbjK